MSRTAVVLMAYGSPERLEDVPVYYADIRGGRAIVTTATAPVICAEFPACQLALFSAAPLWYSSARFMSGTSFARLARLEVTANPNPAIADGAVFYVRGFKPAANANVVYVTLFATGDEHLSVREIAETIVSVFGRGKVTHIEWSDERRRIEIDHIKFSSERLRALTGWQPRYDFRSALNELKAVLERTR